MLVGFYGFMGYIPYRMGVLVGVYTRAYENRVLYRCRPCLGLGRALPKSDTRLVFRACSKEVSSQPAVPLSARR